MISSAARGLCSVDKARSELEPSGMRVFPPVIAVVNLLFCATFEPFLTSDRDGHFHAVFFLTLATILVALSASYFARRTSVLLGRTRTLPVLPHDYFLATLIIETRRRVVIALVVPAALFLLFLYREHLLMAIAAAALTVLLAASIESVMAGINMIVFRTAHPGMTGVVLFAAVITAVTTAVLVFGLSNLLDGIPLVSWAAAGVMAAARGDAVGVLRNGGFIAGAGILTALAGLNDVFSPALTSLRTSKERAPGPDPDDVPR